MNYSGKVVVIAGSAKGIGYGLAKEFAARGAKLALADINEERLYSLVDELKASGAEAVGMRIDVASYEQTEAFCNMVYETYGEVDYLLNNAGVTSMGHILRLPFSDWYRTFEVNTLGLMNAVKTFMPRMMEQDKECFFINTCSNAALQFANAVIPAYAASKAAATSLTHSLAVAMIRLNSKVKFFCHSPGAVATEICMPDSYNVDRSDPYFSTAEFLAISEACTKIIAAGMSVEEYTKGFFAQLEGGNYFIRPCECEEPNVCTYTDRIKDCTGPYYTQN